MCHNSWNIIYLLLILNYSIFVHSNFIHYILKITWLHRRNLIPHSLTGVVFNKIETISTVHRIIIIFIEGIFSFMIIHASLVLIKHQALISFPLIFYIITLINCGISCLIACLLIKYTWILPSLEVSYIKLTSAGSLGSKLRILSIFSESSGFQGIYWLNFTREFGLKTLQL